MTTPNRHLDIAEGLNDAALFVLARLDRNVTVLDSKATLGLPAAMVSLVPVEQHGRIGVRLTAFGLGVKFEAIAHGLIAGEHAQRELGEWSAPHSWEPSASS